ncbi:MAG: hypothetical protein HYX76_05900 [Acidobacteria bacterium]|nr:hypothetical protein [Acidobacteriota bacterium]
MRRPRSPVPGLLALLTLATAPGACGKKGPPLAPLNLLPARVDDVSARRIGNDVELHFTIPTKNVNGSSPADLSLVEVYGFTEDPRRPQLARLSGAEFRRHATRIATIEVRPPAEAKENGENPPPPEPADRRPPQGSRARVIEHLTPDVLAPVVIPEEKEKEAPASADEAIPPIVPAVSLTLEQPITRNYATIGINRRSRPGPSSAMAVIPLGPPPPPPATPQLAYTEAEISVAWPDIPGAPQPVQAPATGTALKSSPVFTQLNPFTFNVYEVPPGEPTPPPGARPLNEQPLDRPPFADVRLEFGKERCYAVRTVEKIATMFVESVTSAIECVTPVDTFPPVAPASLAAVASQGAISLIWEPNDNGDLAGYLVLRAEAPGDTLQPVTSSPVRETTYRDTGVTPGVRYVYAVVAVDTAVPPNTSKESNRVEETAR